MHNLVHDILIDICFKIGIMVRKEAQMGFFSEDGKDLHPAGLLLFNLLKVKDACLDATCISPFAGMGATSWAFGVALHNAVEKKKRKYASLCEEDGYKFIPFAFFTFREFDTEVRLGSRGTWGVRVRLGSACVWLRCRIIAGEERATVNGG
nr:putative reverse transcriptase domain-containing protein [Tanacetum cinerariifolium]